MSAGFCEALPGIVSMRTSGEFQVWFTNILGCALGVSDISWFVNVIASSESEALELAIIQAQALNRGSGLPPHGLRVGDSDIRRLAVVVKRP